MAFISSHYSCQSDDERSIIGHAQTFCLFRGWNTPHISWLLRGWNTHLLAVALSKQGAVICSN